LLKSIEEHERERRAANFSISEWSPSGVACPKCGIEMQRDNMNALASDPPQAPVRCDACGHRTSITI